MSKKKQFKFEAGTRIDFQVKGLIVHGTIKSRLLDEDGKAVYHVHNPATSNPVFTYVLVSEDKIVATYKPVVINKVDAKTKPVRKNNAEASATAVATKKAS